MSRTNTPMLPQPLAAELAAPLIANLATFNEDATIHLVPVWFLWNGEALLVRPPAAAARPGTLPATRLSCRESTARVYRLTPPGGSRSKSSSRRAETRQVGESA